MGGDAGLRLLLDTHIWLWSLSDPDRLTPKVRRALEKAGHELWLSPISTWEVVQLLQKKRIRIEGHFEAWLPRALGSFHEAVLSHDVAAAVADVHLPQGDPADRLLIATARVLNLTLVTADEQLIASRQVPTLANR
jgi:PIN domain nuclease of toxin-antitoxin system